MKELMETQKAYLAGLIDGEGCISITIEPKANKGWGRFSCKAYICNTNRELLEEVENMTGIGKVSPGGKSYETRRLNPQWKPVYIWAIYAKMMRLFLPLITPFLIAKREQAKLASEFLTLTKGQGYGSNLTLEQKQRREEIAARMKELNRRGL